MHVQAHVIGCIQLRFAGVQTHAHPHGGAAWPGLGSQRPLRLDDGLDGLDGAGEGGKERVARAVDHAPAVRRKEDTLAAKMLGAEVKFGPYADAVHRVHQGFCVVREQVPGPEFDHCRPLSSTNRA